MSSSIKAVMTKNIKTIPVGTTWQQANEVMVESRIRHLPVVDDSGVVIGVLSQKDLLLADGIQELPIEFFMSAPVQALEETTPLKQAIYKMLEMKISCLLITDKSDEVLGIVTTDDLLWFLARQLEEADKKEAPLFNVLSLQTLGEVSRMLAEVGI